MLPILTLLATLAANETVIVRLSDGAMVRGAILKSDEGRPFYAFRGIPYAEPPVGQLRFKAPVPKTAWANEVFDATKDGVGCLRFGISFEGLMKGVEDCLIINVYSRQLPDHDSKQNNGSFPKRAVMVFIHGGMFSHGDGTSKTYNPSRMMDSDVILVTLNFRLDLFGFLSTEDESAPGNYGLLDQVLALHWVQGNIELFGGDPDSVTILGDSSGAASVSYHLLSPLSKGLFHRAIMMSGSSLCPWAYIKHPLEWATFVANASGCPTEESSSLVECLRTLPPTEMLKAMFDDWDIPTGAVFAPTMDGHFLPASPKEILRSPEKINHVPVVSGVTAAEAGYYMRVAKNLQWYGDYSLAQDFMDHIMACKVANDNIFVVNMIKRQYFPTINQNNLTEGDQAFVDALSDGMFNMPHYEEVEFLSEAGLPVFVYHYGYIPELLLPRRPYGAERKDDIRMLFGSQKTFPLDAEERNISKVMRKLWTNFAKTGNPTPDDDEAVALPKWNPSSPGKIRIHHLAQPMGRESTYDVRNDPRFHLWTKEIPEARDS